jgi:peptidoglycan LD-endopeptidase CwlK
MDEKEVFLQEPKHIDSSRDITHAHPYLRERWPKLVYMFQQETGRDLIITCTWRSQKEQNRLYQQGRTTPGKIVTQVDGYEKKSKHNVYPARAIDVAVDVDPNTDKTVISWQEDFYRPLGPICKKLGLVWGGAWERFPDLPHIEVPSDVA